MSLTSYRTAPPRVTDAGIRLERRGCLRKAGRTRGYVRGPSAPEARKTSEWVFFRCTPAAMPGDVLLFQRLSVSTIGAAWFHVRVRDGIGWVTGAMATKQWSRRVAV